MSLINRFLYIIGWLLSPFTTWNDVIINIPLAYFSASLFFKLFPYNFPAQVIAFYWLSNGLGLLMMYIAGRSAFREKKLSLKSTLITLLVYSSILLLINKLIALKPI